MVISDIVTMQEDRRRDREEDQRRQLAVRGREALHQQIQDNAHLRELARVRPRCITGWATR
jgi:hypothetical protein